MEMFLIQNVDSGRLPLIICLLSRAIIIPEGLYQPHTPLSEMYYIIFIFPYARLIAEFMVSNAPF